MAKSIYIYGGVSLVVCPRLCAGFFSRREHGGTWREHDLRMGGHEGGHKGTAGNTEATHKERKGKMKRLLRNQAWMGDPLYSPNSLFIFPLRFFCDTSIFPYVTFWPSPCEGHDLLCCSRGPIQGRTSARLGGTPAVETPPTCIYIHIYVYIYMHTRVQK